MTENLSKSIRNDKAGGQDRTKNGINFSRILRRNFGLSYKHGSFSECWRLYSTGRSNCLNLHAKTGHNGAHRLSTNPARAASFLTALNVESKFNAKKSTFFPITGQLSLPVFIVNCCRKEPRDPAVVMSISLLYETIMKIFETWPGKRLNELSLGSDMFFRVRPWNSGNLILLQMVVDGWMVPVRVGDTFLCSMSQINEATYWTKHAEGCTGAGCHDMVADEKDILRILKNGSIPLILSIDSEDIDESCTITLIESGPHVEYVAISHVWSDGLGNLQRSAIPRCQMLRLSKLIRGLPGRASNILLFWLDTICCPPDAAGQNEAQNLAIGMMRQIYENANAVLVLDSWLESQAIKNMSDTDVLMRIITSPWNNRLWTLQEGALARILFFQFADGSYDIDDGINSLNSFNEVSPELLLKDSVKERVHEFRGFRRFADTLGLKLTAVAGALSCRSTSVDTDEAICLATLLDLDGEKIVRTPPQDRMLKFWSMLESIPLGLAFHKLPRLTAKGYRWAPRTFLRNPATHPSKSNSLDLNDSVLQFHPLSALPIAQGLLSRSDGFLFCSNKHLINPRFRGRDEDGNWREFCCETDEETAPGPASTRLNPPTTDTDTKVVGFIRRDQGKRVCYGKLVSFTYKAKGVIYASHLCNAHWERLDVSSDDQFFQCLPKDPGSVEVDYSPGIVAPPEANSTIDKHAC
ncbi:hypothetical protein K440DRAFT_645088 [Wilcoxina mikolae CBS 423.85]|nr:hypothetical protein K440DRAFT_645088 [Wilcoxina mikolae CBS 423.85]